MAINNMAGLQGGDIVIVTYGGHNAHTMIVTVINDGNGNRASYNVAHSPGPGLVTAEETLEAVCPSDEVDGANLFAWRRADNRLFRQWYSDTITGSLSTLRTLAATLARTWSTTTHTAYGNLPAFNVAPNASRARGVAKQYDRGKGNPPMIGYDGLYRIFKWAQRHNQGTAFSTDRGTTCCAFVTACHQTAAMLIALNQQAQYVNHGFTTLRNRRRAKNQVDDGKALRGVSNVGTDWGPWLDTTARAIWRDLAPSLQPPYVWTSQVHPPLDAILTKPLMVDAKYLYTLTLKDRLNIANNHWLKL